MSFTPSAAARRAWSASPSRQAFRAHPLRQGLCHVRAPASRCSLLQTNKKGPARLRKLDYAERNGYVRGVVTAIEHDPGRGAPIAHVRFRNTYRNQKDDEVVVCPEGVYTGQFLYMGKKAQLAVGNVLPVGQMPEGTIICSVERFPGDRGKIAKASGGYATIIGHNEDAGVTKVRMPSGGKKNIMSGSRAMVRPGCRCALRLVRPSHHRARHPAAGRHRCRRRAHGEAHAQGRAHAPQVRRQGQQVAQDLLRGHERSRPPSRRR